MHFSPCSIIDFRMVIILYASVVSSFYYGNLTYPSQDLPRMGFLSTVPSDANDRMKGAVRTASMKDGNFPGESLCDLALRWVGHEADVKLFFSLIKAMSESAPAGPPSSSQTNAEGVPEANPTDAMEPFKSSAARRPRAAWVWVSAMGLTGIFMI
jgi:phytepsin